MSVPEPQHPALKPEPHWFQFSLRTLLLLFVLLASSLGVFGAWGIANCALVVGLAVFLDCAVTSTRRDRSTSRDITARFA